MGLNIRIPIFWRKLKGPEYSLFTQCLYLVNNIHSLVITFLRLSFGILMHQNRANRFPNFRIGIILARNHHKGVPLSDFFFPYQIKYFVFHIFLISENLYQRKELLTPHLWP